ncbi:MULTISPECIES: hypothetical protein [Paraburkholderia]|uniref:hypothetical protein n=1 Tax=Paraburkholderia TaxID=1822464 RepID=UPI00114D3187|nr:hypothetical protein [Paraburkholderia nodosa]
MRNEKVRDQEQPCLQKSAVNNQSMPNLSRYTRTVTKLFAHKTMIDASERPDGQKSGRKCFPRNSYKKSATRRARFL